MGAEQFEIVVRGTLSQTIVAALEGFDVSRVELGRTHLIGWVPDQARLHGLLEVVQALHIELISVNLVASNPAQRSTAEGSQFS